VVYAGTRPLRISLKDLRQLKDALARPPLAATPTQIWRAFEATEVRKVAEASQARTGGNSLADLVQLVRHAIQPREVPLTSYADEVRYNFSVWRAETRRAGVAFTGEQEEWLD